MMARSVFAVIAAAMAANAGQSEANSVDVRIYSANIAAEAGRLSAMASMQRLDLRSHQAQLENLRAEVNGLGAALGANASGPVAEKARDVAGLLTQAIEVLNETANPALSAAYKQTVRKLESAAGELLMEARQLRRERD